MEKKSNYHLPILIYDAECPLCKRFSQSLSRVKDASHINRVPYQDDELFNVYPFLNRRACEEAPHLMLSEDFILVGKDVVDYLIRLYPIVKNFSWLLDKEMGQKAVEVFYNASSKMRAHLKARSCPACPHKKYFL